MADVHPRRKLVERFEVVGFQRISLDRVQGDENWPSVYDALDGDAAVRVYLLHYPTHSDARLGAMGLRIGGITVMGITDLHTGKKVDDSELQRRA